jgi:tetratricopeptide (TPR) repeat protein
MARSRANERIPNADCEDLTATLLLKHASGSLLPAYEQKGRLPEAIETNKRGLALEGNTELWAGLGHAYAVSGNKADAQKVLDQLKELSAERYVAPYNVAVIYAGLGENDEAFRWLQRAYDERSYILAEYLNTDSRLDNLRVDQRFGELRRAIGLPVPR